MNRRKFLRNTSALAIPTLLNGMVVKAFSNNSILSPLIKQFTTTDKVLVLVQLFGGNDGLNTLIPLDSYNKYHNARKNIAIPENKVLPLTGVSTAAMHPSLGGLRDLYNEGKLTIVQSVGYPAQDFSHFRSTDIWLSASDANETLNTGWMGRYLHQQYPEYPAQYPNTTTPHPLAIQIGTATSFLFQGVKAPMGINVSESNAIHDISHGFSGAVPATAGGKKLDFVRQTAEQAQLYGEVIKKTAATVTQQAPYPQNNPLADQLKIVAKLIKSDLQTKIYLVGYDGFDTHAQQVNNNDATTGRHADLLKVTGDAIKAFQDDLKFLGIEDKVMGMTFSEFGRRIVANDSLGTDHGAAAPLFVFGKNVKAGIIGKNPVIPDNVTADDNLAMEVDFRSIYSTMMKDWLAAPSHEVKAIFKKEFPALSLIK